MVVSTDYPQISAFTTDLADFFQKTTGLPLKDGIFETGAYRVPSKSLNSIVVGQGGPSSNRYSNPSWACRWHNFPLFQHSAVSDI